MAIKLKYQPASTPPLGEMPIEIHCIQARFDWNISFSIPYNSYGK